MKLFVDTNVVVDAYSENNRFRKESSLLLALGELGEFELYTSPTQWTDVFYILSNGGRRSQLEAAKAILKSARKKVGVSMMGEAEIDKALASAWDDFEDSVVYQAAVSAKADAFITNNKNDFALSSIPTFTCKEFFKWLDEAHGIVYENIEF